MIDPLTEDLITPAAATNLYPRGPGGKKVHIGKVYRDFRNGLESVRTPRLATSRQAVARFFRRLSDAKQPEAPPALTAAPQRINNAVESELDRLGF